MQPSALLPTLFLILEPCHIGSEFASNKFHEISLGSLSQSEPGSLSQRPQLWDPSARRVKKFVEQLAVLCRCPSVGRFAGGAAAWCSVELGEDKGWQALELALLSIQEVPAIAPDFKVSIIAET